MEKPERKEMSERELKERRKPGPRPKSSGVYDQHFSVRLGLEHIDILDRIGKGKPRGEVMRDIVEAYGRIIKERDAKKVS